MADTPKWKEKIRVSTEIPTECDTHSNGCWGKIIPKGAKLVSFPGQSSVGKTFFLYRWHSHISKGEAFLEQNPFKPLRIVSVDTETDEDSRRFNLNIMGRNENWAFYDLENSLESEKERNDLIAAAKDFKADVISLDSLSSVWPVDDEDNNSVANYQMRSMFKINSDTGALVLFTHHTGWEARRGRGASARRAAVDMEIVMLGDPMNDERELRVVKSRLRNLGMKLGFRLLRGEYDFELSKGLKELPKVSPVPRAKVAILKLVDKYGMVKRKFIVSELEKEDLKPATIDRALKSLVEDGILKKEHGSYLRC